MTKARRALISIAAVSAVFGCRCPDALAGLKVLADVRRPTTVDAYGDAAVWSSYSPDEHDYRLVLYSAGVRRTLRLRGRPVPFDVSLGPDGAGRLTVTFSRCRRELRRSSQGPGFDPPSGCRLCTAPVTGRVEHRIPTPGALTVGSPSRWRDAVSYVAQRGSLLQIRVRSLQTGSDLRVALATPDGAVDNPDLVGHRIIFERSSDVAECGGVTSLALRSQVLRQTLVTGLIGAELRPIATACTPALVGTPTEFVNPSLALNSVVFLQTVFAGPVGERRDVAAVRLDWKTGTTRLSPPGSFTVDAATSEDGRTSFFVLRRSAGRYTIVRMS